MILTINVDCYGMPIINKEFQTYREVGLISMKNKLDVLIINQGNHRLSIKS